MSTPALHPNHPSIRIDVKTWCALQYFRKAVELEPKKVDYRKNLAQTLEKAGKRDEAIKEYEALLRLDSTDTDALYSLAELYRRQNNRKKERGTYERILKLEPNKAEVRNALALLYIDEKDYNRAIKQLKKAIQYDSKNLTYQLNLARTYEYAGQLEQALAQYKAIYKADPNSDEAKSKIPSLNLQIIRQSREAAVEEELGAEESSP